MANVTNRQRKAFFAYVRQPGVGINKARSLMAKVTKGITSLRDPKMTPWKMGWVLKTFDHYFSSLKVQQGKNTIALRTGEQKQEILRLKKALNWADEKYRSLCRMVIGRHEPMTWQEADRIIQEMKKLQRVTR